MPRRVQYYLVCHEVQGKVSIGWGYHTLEKVEVDGQGLRDFLAENIIFPFVVEYAREDIADYREYKGAAVGEDSTFSPPPAV